MCELDWLCDEARAVLGPHLPKNRPSAPRVDDHPGHQQHFARAAVRLPMEGPSAESGRPMTIYNRYNRRRAQGLCHKLFARLAAVGNIPDELSIDSTHIKAHRPAAASKKRPRRMRRGAGDRIEAMPRSRGGRTSKILALATLKASRSPADKAYDAGHLRKPLQALGSEVIILSNGPRRHPYPLNRIAYRRRNVIERMFCRNKDWRRIDTHYDRLARNSLPAVAPVATICFWPT